MNKKEIIEKAMVEAGVNDRRSRLFANNLYESLHIVYQDPHDLIYYIAERLGKNGDHPRYA